MVGNCASRFKNLYEPPLASFRALTPSSMLLLDSADKLAAFGNEDLRQILLHFSSAFPEKVHDTIIGEYQELKVHWRGLLKVSPSASTMSLYQSVLNLSHPSGRFAGVSKLVELMLAISGSTAQCERSFSAQNIIKTNLRATLNQDSLQMLMRVKVEGPPLAEFNPTESIGHWLTSGSGSRHVGGHRPPTASP